MKKRKRRISKQKKEKKHRVQFSSRWYDGICALGKANMSSTASLRSFPNVALELFTYVNDAVGNEHASTLPTQLQMLSHWLIFLTMFDPMKQTGHYRKKSDINIMSKGHHVLCKAVKVL